MVADVMWACDGGEGRDEGEVWWWGLRLEISGKSDGYFESMKNVQ